MRDSNKSTELFKQVIEQKLSEMGQQDELFARSLMKAGKNIDDCITYILRQVQQSGVCGFTDDEVFGMAAYYYCDEDDIEVGSAVQCNIVMNHTVQLTSEEKRDAKKQALEHEISEQRAKLRRKPPVTTQTVEVSTQKSLF